MNKTWPILFLICTLCGAAEKPVVITNVTLIDVKGAPSIQGATVTIQGARITAIETGPAVKPPQGARIVDGTGKFLIPGLWDMHTHWYVQDFMALFPVNGVVGIRQMAYTQALPPIIEKLASGKLYGPRMINGSAIIDGPEPFWGAASHKVTNVAEAVDAVDHWKDRSDFLKIYALLGEDAFHALAEKARARGTAFVGHVPFAISVAEASDAGMASIEHFTGMAQATSSLEAVFRKEITAHLAAHGATPAMQKLNIDQEIRAMATYDPERSRGLLARLARNQTWQCPTLSVMHHFSHLSELSDAAMAADPRYQYIPRNWRNNWRGSRDRALSDWDEKTKGWARDFSAFQKRLLKEMDRAGVPILAGTDVQNPYCMPGFSLHDELALMVEAGLSPLAALQSATLNPARFLKMEADHGTIEVGKVADLVLLRADPLKDIRATREIEAVILDGKIRERAELDKVLARLKKKAR